MNSVWALAEKQVGHERRLWVIVYLISYLSYTHRSEMKPLTE